ncbi:MAG: thiamine biosynthesis protein ThiS [Coprobacter sp.]|nr:thiamine biosynthesis protein ThiS [Coprobacter sp.]
MKVYLNNEEICIGSRVLLKDLMVSRSITEGGFSVAVNNRIIVPEEWKQVFVGNGDKVTVVAKTTR